jgi:hypothetical protein
MPMRIFRSAAKMLLTALRVTLWTLLTVLWPLVGFLFGGCAALSLLATLLFGGVWLLGDGTTPAGMMALTSLGVGIVASAVNVAYGSLVFALEPRDRVTIYTP